MNIGLMKINLKEAFKGVMDAAVELRFMAKDVKTGFKKELDFIGANINKTFENKYLKMDGKLTSIYKLKKLREYFEDMDPDRDLEQPEVQIKK